MRPVSILTPEQTQYYFLSGFTAKLAGTERGITEPTPTFSACFGQAFLELHPTKYGEELVKMQAYGAKAYLVNTGWNGTGKRITIKDTRGIIDAILCGAINEAPPASTMTTHDRLGAGLADQDAARVAQCLSHGLDGGLHSGVILRGLLVGDLDVLQHLRIDLQRCSQLAHRLLLGQHDFHHLQARQDAVAGAGVLAEKMMWPLCSPPMRQPFLAMYS